MLALEITAKPEHFRSRALLVLMAETIFGKDTLGDFAWNLVVFRIKDENLIENENIHEILFKRYGSFESL